MLYIIGAGGHAHVLREAARLCGWSTRAICEAATQDEHEVCEEFFLQNASDLLGQGDGLICGIGSVGPMHIREQVIRKYEVLSLAFQNLFHPSASVAHNVKLGRGIFVAQGCQIVCGVQIDDHALINTSAVIDHDTHIGMGSHVGPGAILCGSIECGRWVHIGSGSVIIQGRRIADGVTIGAGAVVTRDITEPNSTWVGSPARRIH